MAEPRKRRGTGRVTLTDVAKLAGVGSMTVSRALRTPGQVSDKLREQIQKAVDELGYIPNKAAGELASGQSYSVAVILPSLTEKSCTHFMTDFQQKLKKMGYQLLLGYSNYSVEQEEDLLSTLIASNLAAIVLFGCERSATARQILENSKLPVLEVAELCPLTTNLNVGVDHYEVGKMMTRHLIGQGYKNIGFIGARGNHSILRKQLRGWQTAMIDNYLPPDHFLTTNEGPSIEFGSEGIAKLLLREKDLDAVVCSHEDIAMGAMFECQRRSLKIPKDLAITCLDGSQFSKQCYPPLTAVHINYKLMGIEAANKLADVLGDSPDNGSKQIDVGFKLY